ncbi:SDR family oxidoreductase [Candidatus Magnetaquicoccus inordinatus]|uniref:SDR family oxidoreductase n=1 Tax=Candidatus Magnetaquicoccus inordinatus TaxID=2496818 RepID=UPI00102C4BCE|nr:NAD(P)-dependent oxidoreductase [Candidatus Magnetaquicoccus inordinatus]
MERPVVLLGHTGKMGMALQWVLAQRSPVLGISSSGFNAADPEDVERLLRQHRPEVVVNAVAYVGVEQCEQEPALAQRINTLFPYQLARLSREIGFVLIHLSGSTVFTDLAEGAWTEEHCPAPINIYGVTKLGGDALVAQYAPQHYIFRLPILFGPSARPSQFVEKMLALSASGTPLLRIAQDVYYSPSYTRDLALAIRTIYQTGQPWGLYHLANDGMVSLYDLLKEFDKHLHLAAKIEPVMQKEIDPTGVRPVRIPLASVKRPPLRPWYEAVADYCQWIQSQ